MDLIHWDKRFKEWGVELDGKPYPKWKLVSAVVLDPVDTGQSSFIRVAVLDDSGNLKPGVVCCTDWVGRDPKDAPPNPLPTERDSRDKYGKREFPMGQSIITPGKGGGVFFAWVEDQPKSDLVKGMGKVNNQPTSFELTYKWETKQSSLELSFPTKK
jgi:hypothetical protein